MPAPTMKVNAEAIWNEEKGKWEVTVHLLNENFVSLKDGEPCSLAISEKIEVVCCDEFVIPMAILEAEGLDTISIAETLGLHNM